MTIKWDKVKAYFSLYAGIYEDRSLEELFDVLYNIYGLSWRKMAEVTKGYVSEATLRNKGKSLGIKMRKRGGPNYKGKEIKLKKEEYFLFTNTDLARKYRVSRGTIIRQAKSLGLPHKPRGFSPRVEDSDNAQLSLRSSQDP